ncbi:cofilin actophorin [Penicillium waksmanii]|uniref:cofilin actophorin n=1 Tax=Penicillium waksmanii TaxID=69791 RepID=UPI002548F123|nr:cofilin actophorin [Penicillium waksmanii]KAJ5976302.1 cofilin actophorin [Penicillium waksmanii]
MGLTGVCFHLDRNKAGSSYEDSLLSLESKSVNIPTECITAYTQLHNKRGANKPSLLIYKISDDKRSTEVEESSTERNYEAFLQKLTSSVDREGNPAPRMLYAATKEQLRRMLDVKVSIHADVLSDIEWMRVVREASGGRLQGW